MKKSNMAVIGVVVVVIVIGLAVALSKKDSTKPKTNSTSSNSSTQSSTETNDAVPTNAVGIADMAFSPKAISVSVGTTVHWSNSDTAAHTVTADDGSFDSGNLEKFGTFEHTFNEKGTFKYHCTYHSVMTGTVVVR